jgi:hypothetical protein
MRLQSLANMFMMLNSVKQEEPYQQAIAILRFDGKG